MGSIPPVSEWPLPETFILPDLVAITGRGFDSRVNELYKVADKSCRVWFRRYNVFDNDAKTERFLDKGNFDLFAGLSFPDADLVHMETCLAYYYWAFSTDDYFDNPDLSPKEAKAVSDLNEAVAAGQCDNPTVPCAAILQDILRRLRVSATPGNVSRFIKGFRNWNESLIKQNNNRSIHRMPSIEEFILMRRATIGSEMTKALVEFAAEIDLPDYVFDDPIMIAMEDATTDILTWPNDFCSFNKEQADGDFQNMVFVIMKEHNMDLQQAINYFAKMLDDRVQDYIDLKAQLRSFGPKVDAELARYNKYVEYFVQGTVVWYYESDRYFRGVDVSNKKDLLIKVHPRKLQS